MFTTRPRDSPEPRDAWSRSVSPCLASNLSFATYIATRSTRFLDQNKTRPSLYLNPRGRRLADRPHRIGRRRKLKRPLLQIARRSSPFADRPLVWPTPVLEGISMVYRCIRVTFPYVPISFWFRRLLSIPWTMPSYFALEFYYRASPHRPSFTPPRSLSPAAPPSSLSFHCSPSSSFMHVE